MFVNFLICVIRFIEYMYIDVCVRSSESFFFSLFACLFILQALQALRKSPLFEKRKVQFLQYLSKIILTDQLNIRREISQIFSDYFEGV